MIVEGSKIVFVGRAFDDVPPFDVKKDNGGILIPGLVNAHTHVELTALRGFLEGLDFRDWLRVLTSVRATVLDQEALLTSSLIGIHEGLLAGITTYADTTASGVPIFAMREMGVRGIGYIETFGPSATAAGESMKKLEQQVEDFRKHDTALVQTGVSPHAPYTVSAALFSRVAQFARANDLPVAVHVAESRAEVHFVRDGVGPFADGLRARGIEVKAHQQSPIQFLASTGILDDTKALLIHCIQIDEVDADLIASRGATIVHCPVSNAKLGHGIAPLDLMMRSGIATGLGSDSVASNNRMDILTEARVATLFQSIKLTKPDALSATASLELATIGGARALRLQNSIGTLEAGKDADMAIFPIDRNESRIIFDPADTLVHALAGAVTASIVLVAGEERVRNGALIQDDGILGARLSNLANRLQNWRSANPTHRNQS